MSLAGEVKQLCISLYYGIQIVGKAEEVGQEETSLINSQMTHQNQKGIIAMDDGNGWKEGGHKCSFKNDQIHRFY